jgi:hypothetical protein
LTSMSVHRRPPWTARCRRRGRLGAVVNHGRGCHDVPRASTGLGVDGNTPGSPSPSIRPRAQFPQPCRGRPAPRLVGALRPPALGVAPALAPDLTIGADTFASRFAPSRGLAVATVRLRPAASITELVMAAIETVIKASPTMRRARQVSDKRSMPTVHSTIAAASSPAAPRVNAGPDHVAAAASSRCVISPCADWSSDAASMAGRAVTPPSGDHSRWWVFAPHRPRSPIARVPIRRPRGWSAADIAPAHAPPGSAEATASDPEGASR